MLFEFVSIAFFPVNCSKVFCEVASIANCPTNCSNKCKGPVSRAHDWWSHTALDKAWRIWRLLSTSRRTREFLLSPWTTIRETIGKWILSISEVVFMIHRYARVSMAILLFIDVNEKSIDESGIFKSPSWMGMGWDWYFNGDTLHTFSNARWDYPA